MVHWCRCNI